MSKHIITRLFVGGIVAIFAGVMLEIIAALVLFAGGAITFGGPNVVEFHGGSAAWSAVIIVLLGVLAMLGGSLAGLISWIGALINTAQLEDKLWFVLLLVLGLISFGFIAMLAYVIAGPDSTRLQGTQQQQQQQSPAPAG